MNSIAVYISRLGFQFGSVRRSQLVSAMGLINLANDDVEIKAKEKKKRKEIMIYLLSSSFIAIHSDSVVYPMYVLILVLNKGYIIIMCIHCHVFGFVTSSRVILFDMTVIST